MGRIIKPRHWLLLSLIVIAALVFTACGPPPATPETLPSPTPIPEEDASPPESEPVATPTAQEDPTEEPTPDKSEETVIEVVEESGAAQANQKIGITVETDEPDVSTPREHKGGEYRDVSTSDAVSFHPYLVTDTTSRGYQAYVYTQGLLRLDENTLDYIPNMADSYTISEDGLTFTFHLREDIVWSDGAPLTANDFKWTFDQATDPENEFPYLSQLGFITSYESLDDYTLEIKIDEIYAPALGQIAGLITPLPQHIWEGLDWNDPETNPEINSPSVVSGPYKLVEWKRDQYALFEANPDYWYHGAPNLTRYVQEIVPDTDIAYQKMKSGESDTGPITPENLEEARQLDNVTIYEWWPAVARWLYVGLNMREGYATNDVNVRHAINYAIDKQLLTDEVMLGQAKRMCSVFPETSWVYNPDVPCYEYDPDQAIAKFAEAGYTYQDGTMLDSDGEPLTLRLIYGPNTSQTLELIAITVQDYLSQIGVAVEIQAMEWATFLEATDAAEPDWDMFLGAWSATIDPQIMYTIWAEESIPQLNSVAYINPETEQLFKEAGGTYDKEFRKERYQQIQQIVAEDAPYVFLFYNKVWSGQNNRIQGIEPTPLGIGWNFEDWYIEE